MKNLINLCCTACLLLVLHAAAYAQQFAGEVDSAYLPSLKMHYVQEYTFDRPVHKEAWNQQQPGLHASFGTTDKAYFRTEVPVKNETHSFAATAWRGEKINTQVLVWSPDTLEQVRFKLNNLVNEKGNQISSKNFKLNIVRYVIGNYPYGAKDAVCGNTPYKNGFLLPDRFEPFSRFDVPGHTVRPVWISLDIPAGAEPGNYKGEIVVNTTKGSTRLDLHITVQNQVLPPPQDWKYRLDLWQNPWIIASYNHVVPWSEEHLMLLKKHLKLYADAGGKYITTYGVHSPWADNSYTIEGGMIDWIKKKDGTWKFDYTIFDTYVNLAMQQGITKAITIYTAVPWGDRFQVKDEATGNYSYETWAPGSEIYSEHWNIFLTDLRMHLEKKGWFGKTYIGINESEMSQTLAAIRVIKKHSKDWKITYAGNWHQELDGLLDDYSFLYGNEPNEGQLRQRAARGVTSTFYVCCNPAKPNNFVFSPPIEGRWISWYSAAFGYNGFLRWAYDAWPEDPNRDARFGSWPSGDCYMIYPGANSCIRFETLREGIADYEKIRILKDLVAASSDGTVKELWKKFEQHMKVFTAEKDFNEDKITGDVNRGRTMVDEISDRLSGKKTL